MIKLLIVDDSKIETLLLKEIFEEDPAIKVIGVAKNGKEAIELTEKLKPDLITMDICMPVMDGIDAIKFIMASHPAPIVVISSKLNDKELNATFKALEAGALSVLDKPANIFADDFSKTKKRMIATLKSMAEIKVIKRRFHVPSSNATIQVKEKDFNKRSYELITIGASVGGPQALKKVLTPLPEDFPLPIVIVQHMTKGYIEGFVRWLDESIPLTVKLAENYEILHPGVIYFAPDDHHLMVKRDKEKKLITHLANNHRVSGFCPSITVLFDSIAKACPKNAVGILLTGMGNDGAEGLLELKKTHAHTLIQDPDSAIVFGMAGVAQSLGAVDKVIELDQIAKYLITLTKQNR